MTDKRDTPRDTSGADDGATMGPRTGGTRYGPDEHRDPPTGRPSGSQARGPLGRAVVWLPGLAVALGAAVATAHGLYEVAEAAGVPVGIAWLYPLITDGLALVAYTATARLSGRAARYAWTVVIVAAGLSGLAQASFLASSASTAAAGPQGFVVAPALRFGIGAWPAVAAAVVAHLLYLLATDPPPGAGSIDTHASTPPDRRTAVAVDLRVQPVQPAVQPPVQPVQSAVQSVQSMRPPPTAEPVAALDLDPAQGAPSNPVGHELDAADAVDPSGGRVDVDGGARARAAVAAARLAARDRAWPTVREVAADADVSRGTAASVLKQLRAHHEPGQPLHLITTERDRDDDDTIEATR